MALKIRKVNGSYAAKFPAPGQKLSDVEVQEIIMRYAMGCVTQKDLGELYGVTQGYVSLLCRGHGRGGHPALG